MPWPSSGFTPGANDITATSDGNTPTALTGILATTLADNGGPATPAGSVLTHNLVSGSPALDAASAGPATDQRGIARPQGLRFDIGAFEAVAPTITSSASVTVAENLTFVVDVQAQDDTTTELNGMNYSLTGGADSNLFVIDSIIGVVFFKSAPDFENPTDREPGQRLRSASHRN